MRDMNGGLGCGGWGAGIPYAITSVCERLHGRVIMTITVPDNCYAAFSIKKQRPHCCMNCCGCMGSAAAGKPRHKLKKTHDHQEEAEPGPPSPAACSLLQPRPPATQLRTPALALLRSLLRRGAAAALQESAHEMLLLVLLVLMLLMLIAKKACATRLAGRQVHENRRSASTRHSSGL